jgi:hypothetical protein
MSPSRKKTSKAGPKPEKKAAAAKAGAKKGEARAARPARKPAEAKGAPAPAPTKPAEAKRAPAKRGAREAAAPRPQVARGDGEARERLGRKFACFRCGAKFYDLNRPDPLCPKCGADQRERPKQDARTPAPEPPRITPPRSMTPLLEEDEDEVAVVVDDDELDLGLADVEEPDGFLGDEEDEEEEEAEGS